jgi:glycosyltransferase involved in cell wall biosynthesis
VSDGSTDETLPVLVKYYERFPDVFRIIHLWENVGKGGALKIGFREALGKYILFVSKYTFSFHLSI